MGRSEQGITWDGLPPLESSVKEISIYINLVL
jgi:hypothetical protein